MCLWFSSQKRVSLFSSPNSFFSTVLLIAPSILAASPPHRCFIAEKKKQKTYHGYFSSAQLTKTISLFCKETKKVESSGVTEIPVMGPPRRAIFCVWDVAKCQSTKTDSSPPEIKCPSYTHAIK